MELEAVASVVIEKLKDMLSDEKADKRVIQKLKDMLSDEITNKRVIEEALEKLKRVIADTDEEQRNSEEFKKWAEECLRSLYYVEDTVESFALGVARQKKKWAFLINHSSVLKNFRACQKLRRKMKRIPSDIKRVIDKKSKDTGKQHTCSNGTTTHMGDQNGDAAENGDIKDHNNEDSAESKVRVQQHSYSMIPEDHPIDKIPLRCVPNKFLMFDRKKYATLKYTNSCDEEEVEIDKKPQRCVSDKSLMLDREKQAKLMYTNSYDEEELDIFDIRQDVHDLVERLTKTADDGRALIVQIDGEMGSGKTTLARAVYGSRNIKKHFGSGCAWVTISKESNESDVLRNLLKQVGNSNDYADLTPEELPNRLLECLNRKKYLIVLDDVQSDQWEGLKTVFSDSQNGSTLLLTTTTTVNPMWCVSSLQNVKSLGQRYSWSLFLKKAGWDTWEESSEHEVLKQRILGVCNCLPLNIVLLGSLLSTKENSDRLDYLQKILKSQTNWKTEDIVSLSYTHLPYHLKLCVLYLVLFPKEYDIPVRRLLRLWLSEGFVERKPNIFPEDVVQENFNDLVKRSMIQISKLRSDGSPRRCRLLGVLHDYLLPKAQNISLFHVHCSTSSGEDLVPWNVRRLVEHASSKNIYSDASRLEHLCSYLSFNFQRKDTPAKEVGSLLSRIIDKGFGLLRVLDLEGVYKPSLPLNLGDLFHLRYLGLRWTFLDALPSSVGDLPYLETLDVKHTNINNLPTSMWKLKHLRHLNLSHMRLDMPKHSDRNSLPELLTLWGLSVDGESPVKNGLDRLLHLREAGITFCLSNCEDLLNWISDLTSLQSLRLRSKNDVGHPSDFGKQPLSLSRLSKLSHLNLLGELPKLPENLPQGLKLITLSLSKLTEDPMPILGKLPQLNVLRLLSDSYMGKKIVCPQGGFEELRVLKLWNLKNLEEWNVEERAMEKLKEINIRCCNKLMSIPSTLMKQRSLKELVITNMHEEFKQNVKKLMSGSMLIIFLWQVTPTCSLLRF
ncbi:putative disease resistance RPP13-like protein 2 isoform X2 [Lycium barbarum]|uniref:putative disease resistance RPP13-like protein 2 isoform X2 n=1 Tax=Lycium barbarum TaxID=112863 RepID=UPI00293E2DCC|nr:putative disease resistance RPP13-like protein 2 isoform X2 [Lycium barbarum]